jgi:hypothetical protein
MRRNIATRLRRNAREILNEERLLRPEWMDRFVGRIGRIQSSIGNFIARRTIPEAVTQKVTVKEND